VPCRAYLCQGWSWRDNCASKPRFLVKARIQGGFFGIFLERLRPDFWDLRYLPSWTEKIILSLFDGLSARGWHRPPMPVFRADATPARCSFVRGHRIAGYLFRKKQAETGAFGARFR
jgi:hypothetical protein